MRGAEQQSGFDRSIGSFFGKAVRISVSDPKAAAFFLKIRSGQKRAALRRRASEARGLHVPPFMIVSVTNRCNLRCRGCFAQAQHRPAGEEMTATDLRRLLTEATELGVSLVALAGGEPLTRPEILEVTKDFPEIVFPLVTNGSLLDDAMLDSLRGQRNVIPVISLEGRQTETDGRRGDGVYERALLAMERMRKRRMFFGTSIMVTRDNYALVTGREFAARMVDRGCRLFFYVDYVPIQPGTEYLIPTWRQRLAEAGAMAMLGSQLPGLFVASSASEEAYGGCMAAGKGFIHVNPQGRVEPCPFSPYSDVSLREVSLGEALRSDFLRKIRESGEHLSESEGGCALWQKREWLEGLLAESGCCPEDCCGAESQAA